MPLPVLPDVQFSLPELVGQMFDSVILPGDAMRPVAEDGAGLQKASCLDLAM